MLVIPVRLCKHHPRQGNVLKMWSPHNNLFHLGKYFWKYFDFFVPRKILLPCTGNFLPQSHQINPSAISNTSLCSAKYFSQSHQINPQFDQITFLAVSCSASSTLMSSKKTLGQVSDKEQQRSTNTSYTLNNFVDNPTLWHAPIGCQGVVALSNAVQTESTRSADRRYSWTWNSLCC